MDPITVSTAVVTFATAFKDVIQLAVAVKNTFDQAPDDVNDLKFSIGNLVTLLIGLGKMCDKYPTDMQTHCEAFTGDVVVLHQALTAIHREHIHLLKDYIESQYRFNILAPLSTTLAWKRMSAWYHRDELRKRLDRLHKTVEKLQANFTTISLARIQIDTDMNKVHMKTLMLSTPHGQRAFSMRATLYKYAFSKLSKKLHWLAQHAEIANVRMDVSAIQQRWFDFLAIALHKRERARYQSYQVLSNLGVAPVTASIESFSQRCLEYSWLRPLGAKDLYLDIKTPLREIVVHCDKTATAPAMYMVVRDVLEKSTPRMVRFVTVRHFAPGLDWDQVYYTQCREDDWDGEDTGKYSLGFHMDLYIDSAWISLDLYDFPSIKGNAPMIIWDEIVWNSFTYDFYDNPTVHVEVAESVQEARPRW